MDPFDKANVAVLSQVQALVKACAQSGWDATDAEPISKSAALRAADLIRALPEGSPLPELAPEPDGSISFDWIRSRSRLVSLSVGASGRLPYAWVDGGEHGHGVVVFDGKNIPTDILERVAGV
jgi:hypothetical protein